MWRKREAMKQKGKINKEKERDEESEREEGKCDEKGIMRKQG